MRALILGANGLVGRELRHQLQAILPDWSAEALPWTHERLDICSGDAVHEAVGRHRPDIVVNAAISWPGEGSEEEMWAVNAAGAANVARSCAELGVPLLHLSDGKIYGGLSRQVSYCESDPPRPTSQYTQTKVAAEHAVLRAADAAAATAWKTGFKYWIIRTASLFSTQVSTDLSVTARRISELKEVIASPDISVQPTDVSELVTHLVWLLRNSRRVASGIYHIASSQAISEQQLFVKLADLVGSGDGQIKTVTYEEKCRRRNVVRGAMPRWHVLDCRRWKKICPLPLPDWRPPLQTLLKRLPEVASV